VKSEADIYSVLKRKSKKQREEKDRKKKKKTPGCTGYFLKPKQK